jgi:hypothetical protein
MGLAWWFVVERGAAFDPLSSLSATGEDLAVDSETESAIAAFCGDCHALPRPESFARSQWYAEVRWGYKNYARSGRSDLEPPSLQDALVYYQSRAPEQLQFPVPRHLRLRSSFTGELLTGGKATTFCRRCRICWKQSTGEGPRLLVCDMRRQVSTVALHGSDAAAVLARFDHPAMPPAHLDGDGRSIWWLLNWGLLSQRPRSGRVIWLHKRKTRFPSQWRRAWGELPTYNRPTQMAMATRT